MSAGSGASGTPFPVLCRTNPGRTGRVTDSENAASLVLELIDGGVNVFRAGAVEVLVDALAERGAVDEARALLREHGLDGPIGARVAEIGILDARARLALVEGDFERALDEAREVGRLLEVQGRLNPTWSSWRSAAALALTHLGRSDEAAELAAAELEIAERFGAPQPIVIALHALIVAEPDDAARLALCERALAAADASSAQLPGARVRLDAELEMHLAAT